MLMAALRDGHQHWLVILAVLCAAISAYYYFKVIQAIFFKDSNDIAAHDLDITTGFKSLLVITALLIIVLGLFPSFVTDWLHY
jgi:NADH-quinone oxidoreductase subunit N